MYQTPEKCYVKAPVRKLDPDERREMVMLAIADDSFAINCEMIDRFGIKARNGRLVGFSNPVGAWGPLDVTRTLQRRPRGSWVPRIPDGSPMDWNPGRPFARYLKMPYSEVCMHMRVADKWMWATPVIRNDNKMPTMVQLWDDSGCKFGGPITMGEAGWGWPDAFDMVPCAECGIRTLVDPGPDALEQKCAGCKGLMA